MDKHALRKELAEKLEAELAAMEAAQRATVEGATHEQAKPENDKDTRALEQSYLARGQAQRVDELRTAVGETKAMTLRACESVGVSALVTIEDEKGEQHLFITLHGGGTVLGSGGRRGVKVVTNKSPLGQALLGKSAGDEIDFRGRSLTVAAVE